MKLWKALARNSAVYNSNFNPISNGIEMNDVKSRSPTFSEDSGKHSNASLLSDKSGQFLVTTELIKKSRENLGIIIARTSDVGCPSIASLRPGSVAHTCDKLMPGDKIHSVNGINTARLRTDDVNTLLDNVDEKAVLEIEYALPNYTSQNSLCVTSKVTCVSLDRVDGSLGITLRGGVQPDPQFSRPLIITHVRPHGPAHRSGLIKVGDRLLKVDNHSLVNKTLLEAQQILTQQSDTALTTLTIEYDINIMESVKYATGPLLVEIERHFNEELGLVLNSCVNFGENDIVPAGVYIENIRPASIADRCGALHVGDQILAVDDMYIESTLATPNEVAALLQNVANDGITRLQILPHLAAISRNQRGVSGIWHPPPTQRAGLIPSSPSLSGFSTMNSRRSRQPNRKFIRLRNTPKPNDTTEAGSMQSSYCGYNPQLGVCHSETLNITLCSEGNGYGLSVSTDTTSAEEQANIIITDIEINSVADRSGCLQVGDRLLSINRQPNLTVQEINSLLERGYEQNANAKLELQVEFDVADSIVPTSGIFTVKLGRQNSGLGITITASKINPDDPFIVSEIRRGSIAHRIGTLHTGDRLLAIDNQTLNHATLETAFDILQSSSNDIVTLKIEKVESVVREPSYLFSENVVYTVELMRYGGPLGITISGSEDCIEPIILSRLIEGGLAEKTGALHVGDRILAINGESLINRPLSDAIRLLQTSGDRVQLKISRRIKDTQNVCEEPRENYPSPGVQSIDSAVESWSGSTLLEPSTKPDQSNSPTNEKEDNMSIADTETQSTSGEKNNESAMKSLPVENMLVKSQKNGSQSLQYYSDTDDVFCPSPLPLPNYSFTNSLQHKLETFNLSVEHAHQKPTKSSPSPRSRFEGTQSERLNSDSSRTQINKFHGENYESSLSVFDSSNYDVYHVILYKDAVYDDYGFSVSDGLYEKGVYINRIRKGGPADIVGLLKPFDRILQVNDTKTQDFDCCLTVPLIASAGDRIELIVARNPTLDSKDLQVLSWITEEQEMSNMNACYNLSDSQSTITKTI